MSPRPTHAKKAREVEAKPQLAATTEASCQPAPAGKILLTVTSTLVSMRCSKEPQFRPSNGPAAIFAGRAARDRGDTGETNRCASGDMGAANDRAAVVRASIL